MPSSNRKTARKTTPRATGNRARKPKVEAAKAKPAETPAPAEEKVEQKPAPSSPTAPAVEAKEAGEVQPAVPVIVQLGGVEGRLIDLPTGDVQSLLSDELKVRLDVLREHPSTLELQERVRASEGRCAPIYFTSVPGDRPHFFSGIEQLAAAIGAGAAQVPVIVISAEDAGALQSYLAQKANSKPAETEDDGLYMRVLSYYSD